jgi:hypothetical protein
MSEEEQGGLRRGSGERDLPGAPERAVHAVPGKREHKGDIAAVVLTAKVFGQPEHATGRLFENSTGGLEILFKHLPTYTPLPGVTVALKRLSLSVHAVRKGKRRTYSLITNPAKCSGGDWTGVVKVNFQSPSLAQSVLIPCTHK